MTFGAFPQGKESFPSVLIRPQETFSSKISPIFTSDVTDAKTGESVGRIVFQLHHPHKTITVLEVSINRQRHGYGVSLYKLLQSTYSEYKLQSSDQMDKKRDPSRLKPNAVELWEKLVRLGDAEDDGAGGFRMKK